jgi:hypothetical protein
VHFVLEFVGDYCRDYDSGDCRADEVLREDQRLTPRSCERLSKTPPFHHDHFQWGKSKTMGLKVERFLPSSAPAVRQGI